MLLPLSFMDFLSVPLWIRFHLTFKKAGSRVLSFHVKSGLIEIEDGREPLFDKTSVASKTLNNLTSKGRDLRLVALNLPSL